MDRFPGYYEQILRDTYLQGMGILGARYDAYGNAYYYRHPYGYGVSPSPSVFVDISALVRPDPPPKRVDPDWTAVSAGFRSTLTYPSILDDIQRDRLWEKMPARRADEV